MEVVKRLFQEGYGVQKVKRNCKGQLYVMFDFWKHDGRFNTQLAPMFQDFIKRGATEKLAFEAIVYSLCKSHLLSWYYDEPVYVSIPKSHKAFNKARTKRGGKLPFTSYDFREALRMLKLIGYIDEQRGTIHNHLLTRIAAREPFLLLLEAYHKAVPLHTTKKSDVILKDESKQQVPIPVLKYKELYRNLCIINNNLCKHTYTTTVPVYIPDTLNTVESLPNQLGTKTVSTEVTLFDNYCIKYSNGCTCNDCSKQRSNLKTREIYSNNSNNNSSIERVIVSKGTGNTITSRITGQTVLLLNNIGHLDIIYNRIFNNNSLVQGGRFYNGLLTRNSEERRTLMIDGKQTVELDFGAMHIRMAYHEQGLPSPNDPYSALQDFPRAAVKQAVNIMLNINSKRGAFGIIQGKVDPDKKGFSSGKTVTHLINKIIEVFEPVKGYLMHNKGLHLQYLDSQIAEKVLLSFAEQDKVCLSVHDSFIVLRENDMLLRETMIRAYQEVLKTEYLPVIK